MRFIVFAINPNYVNPRDAAELINELKAVFPELEVFVIPHTDNDCEPIYCVQFADTN